jgi:hypothetical protein
MAGEQAAQVSGGRGGLAEQRGGGFPLIGTQRRGIRHGH